MSVGVELPGPKASHEARRSPWLLLGALPRMCRQASTEWVNDNAPRLGAAAAFYTLLSLAPVIVLAVALAASIYGQDAAEGRLASEIGGVAGPNAARVIEEIIKGGNQPRIGLIATLLGLVILAFGASSSLFRLCRIARVDELQYLACFASSLPKQYRNGHPADPPSLLFLRDGAGHRFPAAGFSGIKSLDGSYEDRCAPWRHVDHSCQLIAALYRIVPDVELKWMDVALGAHDHLSALHDRQGVYGPILRACPLRFDI
jgi:hypothetical protein